MMPTSSFHHPIHMRGDIEGLEFTADTDHRKRRRNRATQSCLNCHTSKRKCDRKRPCQRCIQLGLTGLCVYEIDDPALRDDPSVDENTRLRNRIAELESLVRELRGKPHPRWADSNFRDGDPNEKWHSRALKNVSAHTSKRRGSPDRRNHHCGLPTSLAPIKTEPTSDVPNSQIYRFSPSPDSSIRYNNFHSELPSPTAPSFQHTPGPGHRHTYSAGSSSSAMSYESTSSAPSIQYNGGHEHSGSSSFSDGGGRGSNYQVTDVDEERESYGGGGNYTPDQSPVQNFCHCRSNPASGHAFSALSSQLQSTLSTLRQYSHNSHCALYKRITELSNLVQGDHENGVNPGSSFDPLPTPTDSDIMTPLSATNAPSYNGPSVHGGQSPHEWSAMATTGYNSYFPISHGEHSSYSNGIP